MNVEIAIISKKNKKYDLIIIRNNIKGEVIISDSDDLDFVRSCQRKFAQERCIKIGEIYVWDSNYPF